MQAAVENSGCGCGRSTAFNGVQRRSTAFNGVHQDVPIFPTFSYPFLTVPDMSYLAHYHLELDIDKSHWTEVTAILARQDFGIDVKFCRQSKIYQNKIYKICSHCAWVFPVSWHSVHPKRPQATNQQLNQNFECQDVSCCFFVSKHFDPLYVTSSLIFSCQPAQPAQSVFPISSRK